MKPPIKPAMTIAKPNIGPYDTSVVELKRAERLLADQKLRNYLVTYRLSKVKASPNGKGDYDFRRNHLLALIAALSGKEHHLSTSVWYVKSRHQTAALLSALLANAVDLDIDRITAEMVGPISVRGVTDLED